MFRHKRMSTLIKDRRRAVVLIVLRGCRQILLCSTPASSLGRRCCVSLQVDLVLLWWYEMGSDGEFGRSGISSIPGRSVLLSLDGSQLVSFCSSVIDSSGVLWRRPGLLVWMSDPSLGGGKFGRSGISSNPGRSVLLSLDGSQLVSSCSFVIDSSGVMWRWPGLLVCMSDQSPGGGGVINCRSLEVHCGGPRLFGPRFGLF